MSGIESLHPVLAAGVEKRREGPRYSEIGVAAARQVSLERMGTPTRLPAVESVTDISIPGSDGPLAARLYRPVAQEELPLLVYFHGGGFVSGDLDSHDSILRRLSLAGRVAILSVAYRLAPEHPFPAAIDDAEAALGYALDNARQFGATAVFAGGDSAGAAIALAAAASVGGLAGLILFYPVADLTRFDTESHRTFGDGSAGLSGDDMQWFAQMYAPDPDDRADWRCSPLRIDNVKRVPPSFIATARFDVLRSEGEALARHLAGGGVPVVLHAVEGVNHGFLGAGEAVPQAVETIDAAGNWLNSVLSPE